MWSYRVEKIIALEGSPVERQYDLFEILSDGSPMWRATIPGHQAAIEKLRELSTQTENELRMMHLATNTLIAVMNPRQSQ